MEIDLRTRMGRQQARELGLPVPPDPVEDVDDNDHRPWWSEKEFQARVIKLASDLGYAHYHTHDSRMSPAGFPDLVLVRGCADDRPGRHIYAELKTAKGRVSSDQQRWIDLLKSAGTEVYIWRPVDLVSGEIGRVLG